MNAQQERTEEILRRLDDVIDQLHTVAERIRTDAESPNEPKQGGDES
jgi:hypothetical protein